MFDGSVPPAPGGGDGGDGGRGVEPPRAFATGYKQHSGDMMVYGGGAITVVGVLATALLGNPLYLIMSVAGSLSALYFWPVVDVNTPQLGANADGLYVARIGVIRWDAIRTMRVQRRALRTMNLANLIVEIDPPLPEALAQAENVPLMQRFTSRNARGNAQRLEVSLHTLAMPVDAIEARLNALRPKRA